MKLIKALIALTLLAAISSCSIPVTVRLYNNSGQDVKIKIDQRAIDLPKGQTKEIQNIEYHSIAIAIGSALYKYEHPPYGYTQVEWLGWGPFSRRVMHLQLEPDARVWVTNLLLPSPTKAFPKQPEGFPLEPRT
jgi:hypothetical protein